MNEWFLVTAALIALGGLAHGFLGERMLLIPLANRGELPTGTPPRWLGSGRFDSSQTMMMIRFTWHFFTVVMLSLAVVFFALGAGVVGGGDWTVVRVLAAYFAVFGVLVLVLSRGRHRAWLIGLAAAATAWLGTI